MANPTLVQQAGATWSSGTTIPITIAAPTNGNTLLLMFASPSALTVSSIAGGGGTWSRIATFAGQIGPMEVWAAPNVASGGTTVTITLTGTPAGSFAAPFAKVVEFDNMPATITADGTGAGAGSASSTAITTGTLVTVNGDVLLAMGVQGNSTSTTSAGPTNSFTALTDVTSTIAKLHTAYLVAASPGSYITDWTISAATSVEGLLVAAVFLLIPAGGQNPMVPTYAPLIAQ